MSPQLAKVAGDLKESYWRSALAALSIFIGALALTSALGSRSILTREIPANYAMTQPAAAVLRVDRVDEEVLALAREQSGVVHADARRLVRARVEVAPGDWRPLLLFGVRDFRDLRVARFHHVSGASEPGPGNVLVERSALPVLRAATGDELHIRMPNGRTASVHIAGIVFDAAQAPGWQDNAGYAYASPQTLSDLGVGGWLDELLVTVDGDRSEAQRVAQVLATRLTVAGHTVKWVEVPLRQHPHADHLNSMLLLISTFAALALALAAALTATVIAGILGRQVRQIGIMKSIGATSGRIAQLYSIYVLALALPAVLMGVAVGVGLAGDFASFLAMRLNIDLGSHFVSPAAIASAVLVCLGAPFFAAAWPIAKTVRMSARDAIQSIGIVPPQRHVGTPVVVDRIWTLALRSTFRRPVRLGMTVCTLALAGAALMTAANTHGSLLAAVDLSFADRGDDLDFRLLRPVPAEQLLARVRALPAVRDAEAWGGTLISISSSEDAAVRIGSQRYGLLSVPTGSRMFSARMVTGRMPTAIGEIAVNRPILAQEPSLAIGGEVVLLAGDRRVPAKVVGLVEEVAEAHLYGAMSTFDALTGTSGHAGALRITTMPGSEASVAAAVEDIGAELGSLPAFSSSRTMLRETVVSHFLLLLILLSAAAAAAIAVGGLSFGAAAGLNVLERRREIGVMRALGARPRTIMRILLAEALVIAALSFVLAQILSLALTLAVNRFVGENGLKAALPFIVNTTAVGLWVALAVIVSLLASIGPATSILRRPAREALASE